MKLSIDEFVLMKNFIYDVCGITIDGSKQYLITQRLSPIVEAEGCKSFEEFYARLKYSSNAGLIETVISAITTHETFFFRDVHPFQALSENIFPSVIEKKRQKNPFYFSPTANQKISIWCVAASTGQEPYSVAIIVDEFVSEHQHLNIRRDNFSILSSDISYSVLERAETACYTRPEVMRGVSNQRLQKYFDQSDNVFEIKKHIRDMVRLIQLNLSKPLPDIGVFDIIICRNLLIYFDEKTRSRIFDTFSEILDDDGVLILGALESTYGVTDKFVSYRYKNTILYRKTN